MCAGDGYSCGSILQNKDHHYTICSTSKSKEKERERLENRDRTSVHETKAEQNLACTRIRLPLCCREKVPCH